MYQWARIATGSFRIGLVTAHCKESAGNIHDIEVAATDVFSQRRLEFDANVIAGLTADLLDQQGRYDREAAARVVVEARRRGRSNPTVEDLPQLSVDEVLNAPIIADPIRKFDRAPDRDGAVAFVIVSEDVAAGLAAEPVWITGVATTTGPYWSDGDLTSTAYLEDARRRAGSMAGWDDTPADLVELSAQFSFQHLEFAPVFDKDPFDPALNSSGGWMAGNPFVVTGPARMAEAVHQLRGDSGDRQVENVRRAYAHGMHGLGAQTHTVVALEGSR
jgi:acetyl-CoA acetyltransferase